jgi:hypothetical protein
MPPSSWSAYASVHPPVSWTAGFLGSTRARSVAFDRKVPGCVKHSIPVRPLRAPFPGGATMRRASRASGRAEVTARIRPMDVVPPGVWDAITLSFPGPSWPQKRTTARASRLSRPAYLPATPTGRSRTRSLSNPHLKAGHTTSLQMGAKPLDRLFHHRRNP